MYIFLDESGKPEVFSSKGANLVEQGNATRHLVIAAVRTPDHLELQKKVTEFRLSLLQDTGLISSFSPSYALDSFHAQQDYLAVKNKFYDFIGGLCKQKVIDVHVIVAEKLKCPDAMLNRPLSMYSALSGFLLQGICHQDPSCEIVFSRQNNRNQFKQELELEVERIRQFYWSQHSKPPENIKLTYKHNPHYSHGGLQVADYIAHAVFEFYEYDKPEFLKQILGGIRHIHHLTNKEHFTRSKPLRLSK